MVMLLFQRSPIFQRSPTFGRSPILGRSPKPGRFPSHGRSPISGRSPMPGRLPSHGRSPIFGRSLCRVGCLGQDDYRVWDDLRNSGDPQCWGGRGSRDGSRYPIGCLILDGRIRRQNDAEHCRAGRVHALAAEPHRPLCRSTTFHR